MFVNVNKIDIPETSDGKEAMSSVVLLMASIVYDCIKEKKYDDALHHLVALQSSATCMDNVLRKELSKED